MLAAVGAAQRGHAGAPAAVQQRPAAGVAVRRPFLHDRRRSPSHPASWNIATTEDTCEFAYANMEREEKHPQHHKRRRQWTKNRWRRRRHNSRLDAGCSPGRRAAAAAAHASSGSLRHNAAPLVHHLTTGLATHAVSPRPPLESWADHGRSPADRIALPSVHATASPELTSGQARVSLLTRYIPGGSAPGLSFATKTSPFRCIASLLPMGSERGRQPRGFA